MQSIYHRVSAPTLTYILHFAVNTLFFLALQETTTSATTSAAAQEG
jgi:hypothetical protein